MLLKLFMPFPVGSTKFQFLEQITKEGVTVV